MKVCIVILNWNRKDDTIECLESIGNLVVNNFKLQVIVVDNASTDRSQKEIKRYFKKLTKKTGWLCELVENDKNLGYAAGNNIGLTHAINHSCDYALILNNDTVVNKKLLGYLVDCAGRHPRAALISPKIYFAPGYEFHKNRYKKNQLGKVIWSAGGTIDWDNIYGINQGLDKVDRGQFEKEENIDFATGACLLINLKAVKKVGMFNKDYFMYLEDVDLSYRVVKRRWEIIYCPRAVLWHKVGRSAVIGSNLSDYFITRNRLLFGMSFASIRTRIALIKESVKLLSLGRKWQRKGVIDFYTMRFGNGSWKK